MRFEFLLHIDEVPIEIHSIILSNKDINYNKQILSIQRFIKYEYETIFVHLITDKQVLGKSCIIRSGDDCRLFDSYNCTRIVHKDLDSLYKAIGIIISKDSIYYL